MKNIGLMVGSLRENSYSEAWANAIIDLYPSDYHLIKLAIDKLPFYNQDFDDKENIPESVQSFREEVIKLDGLIIVTPEYNRSIPPIIKNALDTASRFPEANRWDYVSTLTVSHGIPASTSIGGFGSNHHLRQVLTYLNMPVVQQPEEYLVDHSEYFSADNKMIDSHMKKYLKSAINEHIDYVELFTKKRSSIEKKK